MTMSLANIPEHEIREWCSRTGCWAPWRDVQSLFCEIEAIPFRNRAQWITDNEAALDQMNLGAIAHRIIARALAAGADTMAGKAIAEHELVRFSSQLNYWLSRAVLPASE